MIDSGGMIYTYNKITQLLHLQSLQAIDQLYLLRLDNNHPNPRDRHSRLQISCQNSKFSVIVFADIQSKTIKMGLGKNE